MNEDRLVISDELREKIAPHLPGKVGEQLVGISQVRRGGSLACADRVSVARSTQGFRQLEFCFQTISSMG